MKDILGFYKGKFKNASGHSLESMWEWDDERLERGHTYIQWMFPNNEESKRVAGSPVLSAFDIDEFRSDEDLRKRLLKSLNVFVNFLGLKPVMNDDGLKFEKNSGFDSKSQNWMHKENHNHLRITRVLRSLKLLGCGYVADKLYDSLMGLCSEFPDAISENTKWYWKDAIEIEEF